MAKMAMRHSNDSGYGSLSSSRSFNKFGNLLEHRDTRIEKTKLPTLLGEDRGTEERILRGAESQVYYSKDRRFVIPYPLIETIAQRLKARAIRSYVDLHAYATEQDIAFESLEQLISSYARGNWPRVIIEVDNQSYLCTDAYATDIKTRIDRYVEEVGYGVVDLTVAFDHQVPAHIIIALATEATAGRNGEVHLAGEHIIWSHNCASCIAKKQLDVFQKERIAGVISKLETDGFCVLLASPTMGQNGAPTNDDLEEVIVNEFSRTHTHDARPQSIPIVPDDGTAGMPKLIVKPRILHRELEAMKVAIVNRTEAQWQKSPTSVTATNIVHSLQPLDYHTTHSDELSHLLVKSHWVDELEAVSQDRLTELEIERYAEFNHLFETRLWCPLHLYAAGVIETQDSLLKQDLQQYVLEKFCRETIPETLVMIREQNILHDAKRASAIDRLEAASKTIRTFTELQTAVAHAGQELNIETPHEELVLRVKHTSLDQIVGQMKTMTRGLDILQNLIWVLLATSGPGLFVSSVKYTSRMIKQYESVGEQDVTGIVRVWWDKIKTGAADAEDIRQMKELAKGAIEIWVEDLE